MKIETVAQANAAIEALQSKDVVKHSDQVKANAISSAIEHAEQYSEMLSMAKRQDDAGDTVVAQQTRDNASEYRDTRMSDLAKRLAGCE